LYGAPLVDIVEGDMLQHLLRRSHAQAERATAQGQATTQKRRDFKHPGTLTRSPVQAQATTASSNTLMPQAQPGPQTWPRPAIGGRPQARHLIDTVMLENHRDELDLALQCPQAVDHITHNPLDTGVVLRMVIYVSALNQKTHQQATPSAGRSAGWRWISSLASSEAAPTKSGLRVLIT